MTTGAICPIARLRHWVAGLALLAACSLLPHPVLAQTYFPPTATNDWRTLLPAPGATPDAAAQQLIRDTVSLDWAQLEEAWDYSALFHPNSALLIIRDGWVAGEWGNTSRVTSAASVSKSLTGIALARLWSMSDSGQLAQNIGPDSFIDQFLPIGWSSQDARRAQITLRHLMTMSSGIEPHDEPNGPGYTSQFILDRAVQNNPGEVWSYSSLSVDLASIVFQNAAGVSVGDVLASDIFGPIGAQADWNLIDGIYTLASSSARTSVYDLARIAYLLLQNGQWDGQQLINQTYLSLITQWAPQLAGSTFAVTPNSPFIVPSDSPNHFGYFFWTNRTGVALGANVPSDAFYAHGFAEDLMIVIPSLSMVIVRMGNDPRGQDAVPFRSGLMSRIMAGVLDPPPTINLTAQATSVDEGQSTILDWTSTNANQCTAAGAWSGTKALSGSQSVGPLTQTSSFTLTCTGDGGSAQDSLTITVAIPPPLPVVNVTAQATSVDEGQSTILDWTSTNANQCTAAGAWSGTKALSGSQSVGPLTQTSSFTLTCTGDGGSAQDSVTITVTIPPPPPVVNLTAQATSVGEGGSTALDWTSTNANQCTAAGAWSGTKALSGSQSVGPLTQTSSFTLTCTGDGGSAQDSITITVGIPPPLPVINLTAQATSIDEGQSTILDWTSTNANQCTAAGAWSGTKGLSGSQSVGPLTQTSSFTLTCTGDGGSAQDSVTITVGIPPPAASPTAFMAAQATTVTSGQSTILDWTSTNANQCTAAGAWSGTKGLSGSQNIGPLTQTSTFTLTCLGTGGTVSDGVTIVVVANGGGNNSSSSSGGSGASGVVGLLLLGWATFLRATARRRTRVSGQDTPHRNR